MASRPFKALAAPRLCAWLLAALAPAAAHAQTSPIPVGTWTLVFETDLPGSLTGATQGLCFNEADHGTLMGAPSLPGHGGSTTPAGTDLHIANPGGSECFVTPAGVLYASCVEIMLESSRPYWTKRAKGEGGSTETTEADWNAARLTRFGTAGIGYEVKDGRLAKTLDGGITWTNLETGSGTKLRAAHTVPGGDVAYAVGDSGVVLKTVNAGAAWTRLNTGALRTLKAVAFLNASTGYVAGESGTLLGTVDGGVTWTRQKKPDTAWNFTHLAVPVEGVAYAATDDGSLLRCSGSCADASGPVDSLPSGVGPEASSALATLRPREGVLEFRLRASARVRVRVLDARGVLLAEPLNAMREAGPHRLALPELPQGAHRFLEFRADDVYQVLSLGGP